MGEATSKAEDDLPELRMRIPEIGNVIGMRNRIAHGYDLIDNELIWSTAVSKVPQLCATLERMLEDGQVT